MHERRLALSLQKVRLMTPDPRLDAVQRQIAAQVARLNDRDETDALTWIEAVSEFDAADASGRNARKRPR
jgi:hypothetical protein